MAKKRGLNMNGPRTHYNEDGTPKEGIMATDYQPTVDDASENFDYLEQSQDAQTIIENAQPEFVDMLPDPDTIKLKLMQAMRFLSCGGAPCSDPLQWGSEVMKTDDVITLANRLDLPLSDVEIIKELGKLARKGTIVRVKRGQYVASALNQLDHDSLLAFVDAGIENRKNPIKR